MKVRAMGPYKEITWINLSINHAVEIENGTCDPDELAALTELFDKGILDLEPGEPEAHVLHGFIVSDSPLPVFVFVDGQMNHDLSEGMQRALEDKQARYPPMFPEFVADPDAPAMLLRINSFSHYECVWEIASEGSISDLTLVRSEVRAAATDDSKVTIARFADPYLDETELANARVELIERGQATIKSFPKKARSPYYKNTSICLRSARGDWYELDSWQEF